VVLYSLNILNTRNWTKTSNEQLRLCDPQGCDFNAFGQLLDDDSEVNPEKTERFGWLDVGEDQPFLLTF
jgi:hypothetical protein